MTDIVKCLRSFVVDEPDYGKGLLMSIGPEDVERAAAEIERLRAALREIAAMDEVAIVEWKKGDGWLHQRVARAALKEDGDGK